MTAAQIYDWVFAEGSNLCISANGTIFRTDIEGAIPGLLTEWYNDRVRMKKLASSYGAMASGVEVPPELMKFLFDQYRDIPVKDRTKDYPAKELAGIIKDGNVGALYEFMCKYDVIYNAEKNKIIGTDVPYYKAQADYWDMQQLIKKIQLNSLYGSILNEGSRFFDPRIGQSVTLTGRCISKHMAETINEIATGERDRLGDAIIYGDTDSLLYLCNIKIKNEKNIEYNIIIEKLFELGKEKYNVGEKEYSVGYSDKILTFDPKLNESVYKEINYVYRHAVNKEKWEVEDEDGNVVTITSDHSIMVERDNILIECKPKDILEGDVLISIKNDKK